MQKLLIGLMAFSVLAGLYLASTYNYLLFHSIAEGFAIVIACGIFLVAWNTRRYHTDNYLLLIGIAFLFIGILDVFHTLSYKGMNVFTGYSANAPTQLWIAARYMEALTLLIAPFMSQRRIRADVCFAAYGTITLTVLLSVFHWRVFPDCFLPEAGGLTPFKIVSEYIICLILLGSGALFVYWRNQFDSRFLLLVLLSVGATVAAELAFTTYVSVFGFSNLLGHYLKIVSYYLMYKAVIETGLAKPYDLLFRDLDQQREWLSVTLTSIGDAVIATDTRGRITFMNKVAEDLTGWPIGEAAEKPVQEVFHIVNEHTRAIVDDPVNKVLETGMIVGLANHTILLRKDGGEISIDDSGAPIRDNQGIMRGAVLVFRDISERKRAEKNLQQLNATLEQRVAERTELAEARSRQLQSLAVELVDAEERERRRIAQVLHDDLQQILAGARMQLQAMPAGGNSASIRSNVEKLLDESIKKARSLSHELSPAVLQYSGMVAGMEWLVRQMGEKFGLDVHLETDEAPRVENSTLKTFLFRAVQELLFNVVKHARVKKAHVAVSGSGSILLVKVSDEGQGFDPDQLESSPNGVGIGLLSLKERAAAIGGNLALESAPGQGSRFALSVPLNLVEEERP